MDKIENKPLVAIHCLVYNHEPYLRDCFEGFVMQQTNFPFVAIVHDDCSTDGSAAIIREYEAKYPHIFKPIYETENQYSKHDGSLERIMNEAIDVAETKYVAVCEGDDYWIDSLKLQKQVDFLENHSDYSMCFHSAEIKNECSQKVNIECQSIDNKEYYANDIYPRWIIPTASVLYRNSMVRSYSKLKNIHWMRYGDITLFLTCMHTGKVWGMQEQMSVYRVTNNGAVISERLDSNIEYKQMLHNKFLLKNFPKINKKWAMEAIARYYYTKFRKNNCIFYLICAMWYSPYVVYSKYKDCIIRFFTA